MESTLEVTPEMLELTLENERKEFEQREAELDASYESPLLRSWARELREMRRFQDRNSNK